MVPFELSGHDGILSDLTVVEITTNIAGPFACRLLADNGATVIKVEPPWGAPFRNRNLWYDTHDADEYTYRFLQYNASKHSITLDLKADQGKAILWELLDEADVFIENASAGTMANLGFPWDEMHDRNPELIYCSITGYGESGSFSDLPAYDTAVQGMAGWVHYVGDLDDTPETTGISLIDHSTGLYAVIGVLMALVNRALTGTGQRVDIAMIDVAVSLLGHQFAEYSSSLNDDITPRFDPYFEPAGLFECKDDHMILLVMPEFWDEFTTAIDKPEFARDDSPFATNTKRVDNANALKDELDAVFQEKTVQEWIEYFLDEAPHVAMAPVTPLETVPESGIVTERNMARELTIPAIGTYVTPGPAITFSADSNDVRKAPGLGAQTDTILTALGYSENEITDLRDSGVIT